MLYAAQRISLDFLRVSSILHAAKSAAAAASWRRVQVKLIDYSEGAYDVAIAIRMSQTELVIVNTCGIVGFNRPIEISSRSSEL